MRKITLAATQFACSWDALKNIAKAKEMVRSAADAGASVDEQCADAGAADSIR